MPIEIDASLKPELVPLAWLIGGWEGVGVLGYPGGEQRQFGQRIDFLAPDDAGYLHYTAHSWLLDDGGELAAPLTIETGFWQVARPRDAADVGPGMMPASVESSYDSAAAVESLRTESGDFGVEVSLVHPGGVVEQYLGTVSGAKIEMATDIVARSENAKEYASAKRMYGLVNGELMWAWDMAAQGNEMASHTSARLKPTGGSAG